MVRPAPSLRRLFALGAEPARLFERLARAEVALGKVGPDLAGGPLFSAGSLDELVAPLDLGQSLDRAVSVAPPPVPASDEPLRRTPPARAVSPTSSQARRFGVDGRASSGTASRLPETSAARVSQLLHQAEARSALELAGRTARRVERPRDPRPAAGSPSNVSRASLDARAEFARRIERAGVGSAWRSRFDAAGASVASAGARSHTDEPALAAAVATRELPQPGAPAGNPLRAPAFELLQSAVERIAAHPTPTQSPRVAKPQLASVASGLDANAGSEPLGGLRGLSARFAERASEPHGNEASRRSEADGSNLEPRSSATHESELASASARASGGSTLREARPLPSALLQALGEAELERQIDRILRREAERHGIDLARRRP